MAEIQVNAGLSAAFFGGAIEVTPSQGRIRASLRIWFDPRQVNQSGGVASSAPNLAPGGGTFAFPVGGSGTVPLYGVTGFNGSFPCLTFDATERRLQTTIVPSFGGGGHSGASLTLIMALQPTGALGSVAYLTTAATQADLNSGLYPNPGSNSYDFNRFDDTGATTQAPPSTPSSLPYVYTLQMSGQSGFYVQRDNGQQKSYTVVSLAQMSGQSVVTLGGETNAVSVAFGLTPCLGNLGTVLLFEEFLSPSDLDYWERFAGAVSGITWP